MKITPGNQTLILAGERTPAAGMPSDRSSQLVRSTRSDPVLQRLTIVAAHPDSTMVYLRADYAAHESMESGSDSAPTLPAARTYAGAPKDLVPAAQAPSLSPAELPVESLNLPTHRSDPHGSNRGISLYASTQRMSLESVNTVHVDVHA